MPDVSQRASRLGFGEVAEQGGEGFGCGDAGAAGAQQAVVDGQIGVGEGGGDPVDAVVVEREHGDRALRILGQPFSQALHDDVHLLLRREGAVIEDDGRVAGLGLGCGSPGGVGWI